MKSFKRFKLNNNRGDTIIEVVITTVILSIIVVGAYQTSNQSLANIRDSQSRIVALGVAQNQVERLRANGANLSSTYLQSNGPPFCFYNGTINDSPPSSFCTFNMNTGINYVSEIIPLGPSNSDTSALNAKIYDFEVLITWPATNSGTTDQIQIFYRETTG